jgi:chromosome segregation ATPase
MIKIVREVDAVAADPQVAVDPLRNNQYLSPTLFRQLIPSAEQCDPVAMKKEIAALKVQIEAAKTELTAVNANLDTVKSEKESVTAKLTASESSLKRSETDVEDLKSRLKIFETDGNDQVTDLTELVENKKRELTALQTDFDRAKAGREAAEQNEKAAATELADVKTQIITLKGQNSHYQAELESARTTITQVTMERDNSSKAKAQLEATIATSEAASTFAPKNNLDLGFHGRTVSFVNLASMKHDQRGIALDMGSEGEFPANI